MPPTTLEKAISNNQLKGIPMMNDRRRNSLKKSWKNKSGWIEDMQPEAGSTASEGVPANNNVFCFAALAEKEKGTVYTDTTGALPVMSLDGHQYYISHMIMITILSSQRKSVILRMRQLLK